MKIRYNKRNLLFLMCVCFICSTCSCSGPDEVEGVYLDGTDYLWAGMQNNFFDECPEGFVYAGTIVGGTYDGDAYYENSEQPNIIYVLTETWGYSQKHIIKENAPNGAEMFMRYVKFIKSDNGIIQ